MAERRAQSATKMASNILHGTFSLTYLSTHTIAGGNNDKTALHPDIVQGEDCNSWLADITLHYIT